MPAKKITGKKSAAPEVKAEPRNHDMPGSLTDQVVDGEPSPNATYVAVVQSAWNIVKEQLPEAFNRPALPMVPSEECPLVGFGEPFNPAAFEIAF